MKNHFRARIYPKSDGDELDPTKARFLLSRVPLTLSNIDSGSVIEILWAGKLHKKKSGVTFPDECFVIYDEGYGIAPHTLENVSSRAGVGGYAEVVQMKYTNANGDSQTVACKMMKDSVETPSHAGTQAAEIRFMGAISHPTLMPLVGVGLTEDKKVRVVMLLMNGTAKDKCLLPWDGQSSYIVLYGAALVLSILHRHHILHCDVKMENVMLDDDGYPVLGDLGIASLCTSSLHSFESAALSKRWICPEFF